jgi:hypothetical protein
MGGVAEEKKKKKTFDPGALSALKGRVCVCVGRCVRGSFFLSPPSYTTPATIQTTTATTTTRRKRRKFN